MISQIDNVTFVRPVGAYIFGLIFSFIILNPTTFLQFIINKWSVHGYIYLEEIGSLSCANFDLKMVQIRPHTLLIIYMLWGPLFLHLFTRGIYRLTHIWDILIKYRLNVLYIEKNLSIIYNRCNINAVVLKDIYVISRYPSTSHTGLKFSTLEFILHK